MPKNNYNLLVFVCLLISCNTNIGQSTDVIKQNTLNNNVLGVDGKLQLDTNAFKRQLLAVKNYAVRNNYATNIAFMVDMAMHSGSKRFFVVDLNTGKILTNGLVTHGSSKIQMKDGERKYSNENSSLCTSLGKYKVGEKYYGKFGLAYKLTGLETTNNNAFERSVVLHSHSCVPDKPNEAPICQSWGCPTVSPNFLKVLATYISASPKPILLDIFDSTK